MRRTVLLSLAASVLALSTAPALAQSGEPFTMLRGISFAFIWIGAGVFAAGAWRRASAARRALKAAAEPV